MMQLTKLQMLKAKAEELRMTPLMQKALRAQEFADMTILTLAEFETRLAKVEQTRGM